MQFQQNRSLYVVAICSFSFLNSIPESFISAETTTAEDTTIKATTVEATTIEASTAEVTNIEATTAEAITAEATTFEATTAEATISESSTVEVTTGKVTTGEATNAEATTSENTNVEVTTGKFNGRPYDIGLLLAQCLGFLVHFAALGERIVIVYFFYVHSLILKGTLSNLRCSDLSILESFSLIVYDSQQYYAHAMTQRVNR